MPAHRRDVVDGPLILAELRGLVESQPIHRHRLGRGFERDAIPAQHPRNFKIAFVIQDNDEDEIRGVHSTSSTRTRRCSREASRAASTKRVTSRPSATVGKVVGGTPSAIAPPSCSRKARKPPVSPP